VGKKEKKTQIFIATIGATAGCILRLLSQNIPDDNKGISMGFEVMPVW
jgi:hypothetical protein